MIDGYYGRAQQMAQRGSPRQSPDGGPGIPPQNQAALTATNPGFESPYAPRDTQSPGQVTNAGPPPASNQQPLAHRYGAPGSLIASAYTNHLGREASEQEIGDQLLQGTRMDMQHVQNVLNSIRNSPEARSYQQRQAAAASAPPLQAPPSQGGPPPLTGIGAFGNMLEGFGGMMDNGLAKLGNSDSPKYQFGQVFSHFDPRQGITEELLAALDALGLGDVSGKIGGDKISIAGADPRFNGVTEFDVIRDLGNGGWQWGGLNGPAAQPDMGMMMPGMGMGFGDFGSPLGLGAINPLQGGDYTTTLLQYLAQQLGLNQALGGQ